MHTVQVLTLLLALSGALNAAFAAGLTARLAGVRPAQAILTGQAPPGPSWPFLRRSIRLPLIMGSVRQTYYACPDLFAGPELSEIVGHYH